MSDYRVVGTIDNGNYGMVPGAAGGAVTSRPQAALPMPLDAGRPAPVEGPENNQGLVMQQQKPAQQSKKTEQTDAEKSALPLTNMSNVVLKFKVNEDTRDITLYVIDRESKRVLRSIPPEEMNKLQAGDLLELLA